MLLDHIGIVVADLADGKEHFSEALGIRRWTNIFEDTVNNVWAQFGEDQSGTCFELLAPLNAASPISSALTKRAAILNHVAFLVTSIESETDRLCNLGCLPLGESKPAIVYGGRRIQFLMSPLQFIIELIEAPGHQHQYVDHPIVVRPGT